MSRVQKANPCLKKIVYAFNGLLGIAGCLLLLLAILQVILAIKIDIADVIDIRGIVGVFVIAVAIISLSILGIVGACKENVGCLRVFMIMMWSGALYLFSRGIQFSLYASQVLQDIESRYHNSYHKHEAMNNVNAFFRPTLGVLFGFSAAAVLGVILSVSLHCQIAPCVKRAATSDRVTVPTNANPTTHHPMINSVPMTYYPSHYPAGFNPLDL